MGDNWDEDDFEPKLRPAAGAGAAAAAVLSAVNKFDGEDEDDDVKDCWDDEDEEEKKDEEKVETKVAIAPPPKSKAKKLAEKLAEKEKAALYENDDDVLDGVGLTKEEIELRRRRLQEEADLKVAMETFGIDEGTPGTLDGFNPKTKEEFDEFQAALVEKLSTFRDREEFPDFVSSLVKNICLHLNSITLKVLKTNIESLYQEKQKLEKADKTKKPTKGKGKAKLTMESNISQMTRYGMDNDFDNEYDDFM